jgi:hypothetical protein
LFVIAKPDRPPSPLPDPSMKSPSEYVNFGVSTARTGRAEVKTNVFVPVPETYVMARRFGTATENPVEPVTASEKTTVIVTPFAATVAEETVGGAIVGSRPGKPRLE